MNDRPQGLFSCQNDVSQANWEKGFFTCQNDVSQANWERDGDIFQREQYADQLSRLIKNTTCPYVIALSSSWGTGKSYFLNAWKNKIDWAQENQANKIPCVYFSAWESENDADPALTVVAGIRQTLQKMGLCENGKLLEQVTKSTVKTIINPYKMLKIGGTLAKGFVNHYTDNALDDIGADLYEEHAEQFLNTFINQQEEKINLKQELSKLVNEVIKKTSSPLLIMIDELDRCRPDYVIKLLEHIKHFFSLSNIVFVLAIDQKQLLSTVEHTFGFKGQNREIYLEKFIDLFFHLPNPNLIEYSKGILNCISCHYQYIPDDLLDDFKSSGQQPYAFESGENNALAYDTFFAAIELTLHENDSLRSIEKKLSKFITIINTFTPTFYEAITLLLCIMKNLSTYNNEPILLNEEHHIELAYHNTDDNEIGVKYREIESLPKETIFFLSHCLTSSHLEIEEMDYSRNCILLDLFVNQFYTSMATYKFQTNVNTMLNFGQYIDA